MRQFSAKTCVFIGIFEVINQFNEFRFGLIASGNIRETDFGFRCLPCEIVDKASHRVSTLSNSFGPTGEEEEEECTDEDKVDNRPDPGKVACLFQRARISQAGSKVFDVCLLRIFDSDVIDNRPDVMFFLRRTNGNTKGKACPVLCESTIQIIKIRPLIALNDIDDKIVDARRIEKDFS